MTSEHDPQAGDPDELVDIEAASELVGVPAEQVRAMVDQGVLTSHDQDGELRFRRGELIAARELGG